MPPVRRQLCRTHAAFAARLVEGKLNDFQLLKYRQLPICNVNYESLSKLATISYSMSHYEVFI